MEVFVDAADTVLRTEAGIHIFSGEPEQKRSLYLSNEVTVLISLVGDVSGQAIYGMNVATAQAFISRILGHDIDEFDELARSGIGELANVIAGQASSRLAHLGLRMDISIPMLLLGFLVAARYWLARLPLPPHVLWPSSCHLPHKECILSADGYLSRSQWR